MKVKVSLIFKEKKIQKGVSRIPTRSIESAVHHLYHYAMNEWFDLKIIYGFFKLK